MHYEEAISAVLDHGNNRQEGVKIRFCSEITIWGAFLVFLEKMTSSL